MRKGKDIIPLEISFGNSKDIIGERILTCIVRDITQRKKIERKLKYLAYHDKLTDLGNRDLFYLTLDKFLSHVKRYEDTIGALLFLDLDGFKRINDTLGHNIGDSILCECASRLSSCLRESDHVYRFAGELEEEQSFGPVAHEDLFRFGGDEFVILLTHLNDTTDAAVVAQKIINSIQRPYVVNGFNSVTKANLGVSIGISLIPQNGLEATSLIRSADIAMYQAKETKNCYTFFTSEINKKASERMLLEAEMRNALENNGFDLHFQPLVDVNGNMKGVEALLRWNNPPKGFIPPAEFIPIAEETGLIIPLGDWVLEKACRHLHFWNSRGYKDFYVSVNLSVKQFNQDNVVEKITQTVKKTRIDPRNLKIEITESGILKNPSDARQKMKRIKDLGIRIAIDDFGAGYSSLRYISELPVDILKIDQSFVINLHQQQNTKIINTIIALAHSLNLDVIAEGVETKDQLDYLTSKKCRTFQGFLFGKPTASDVISKILAESKALQPALQNATQKQH